MERPVIGIEAKERFPLSPYLFMQLMEGLGATDGSVEAAWDHRRGRWREDFIEASRELGPTLIRWPGGCVSSYYRWREAVGPRSTRRPMHNILWGGMESNQVGTHEFMTYCRLVGADPLIGVNFESDGRRHWQRFMGSDRRGTPAEAAAWVDYCNNPANRLRRTNGAARPFGVRLWQIGNETSYDPKGYGVEAAARRTVAFAKAMRAVDPSIELIGWGDSGWAPRMLEVAGKHLDYLAFHEHFKSGLPADVYPLEFDAFRADVRETWKHLMHAYTVTERKIAEMRAQVAGSTVKLAMTESHFSAPGRNRSDLLSTWGAGVAYARVLNVHERNGDILAIATLDDFCCVRWMTSAIMVAQPGKASWLMPVARVMSLYRKHRGDRAVTVSRAPAGLDVTASRKGGTLFLHVVNTSRTREASARIEVAGMRVGAGKAFQIAKDPLFEADVRRAGELSPVEKPVRAGSAVFPPASVTALEVPIAPR
jgi:alpha-L-arabinofuranosidase